MSEAEEGQEEVDPAADSGEQVMDLMFPGEPEDATAESEGTAVEEKSEEAEAEEWLQSKALDAFRDGEQIDVKKLAKSYTHLNSKVGELGNKAGSADKLKQELDQAYAYLQSPQVQQALNAMNNPQPAAQAVADVNAEVERLFKDGKWEEGIKLVQKAGDARIEGVINEIRTENANARSETAREKLDREALEFKGRHVKDGLFDAAGEPDDVELVDGLQTVLNKYPSMEYEDALVLAKQKLGRVPASKAKKAPLSAKPGARKTAPQAQRGSDESVLGIDEESAKQLFGDALSDEGWEV